MLLTLSANCLRSRLSPLIRKGRQTGDSLALTDLPRFTRNELGLYGLNLSTSLLAGADINKLDAIREAADKAPCPCLVLIESEPMSLCTLDEDAGNVAVDRAIRVIKAAQRLGCNSVGVAIAGDNSEDEFDFCVERLRQILSKAERLDINLLIMPRAGITDDPERVTEMIKKVGGFRVGTMPDFQTAAKAPDPLLYLRRVVPYASALTASTVVFGPAKKGGPPVHEPYDLIEFAKVVQSVGYQGTLAIDYRGEGDVVEGVRATKAVLESVLELDNDEAPALAGMDELEEIEPPEIEGEEE